MLMTQQDLDFQEIAILDQLGLKIAYDAMRLDLDRLENFYISFKGLKIAKNLRNRSILLLS